MIGVVIIVSVPLSGLVSVNISKEELENFIIFLVSVPLSGLVSVNKSILVHYTTNSITVSVPLSGLVSVNGKGRLTYLPQYKFPSPYRG